MNPTALHTSRPDAAAPLITVSLDSTFIRRWAPLITVSLDSTFIRRWDFLPADKEIFRGAALNLHRPGVVASPLPIGVLLSPDIIWWAGFISTSWPKYMDTDTARKEP
jgi:hypothetical protein